MLFRSHGQIRKASLLFWRLPRLSRPVQRCRPSRIPTESRIRGDGAGRARGVGTVEFRSREAGRGGRWPPRTRPTCGGRFVDVGGSRRDGRGGSSHRLPRPRPRGCRSGSGPRPPHQRSAGEGVSEESPGAWRVGPEQDMAPLRRGPGTSAGPAIGPYGRSGPCRPAKGSRPPPPGRAPWPSAARDRARGRIRPGRGGSTAGGRCRRGASAR